MRDAGKDESKWVKDTAAQGATVAIRRDSHLMARMDPKREGCGVSSRVLSFLLESSPSTQSRRQFLRASPEVKQQPSWWGGAGGVGVGRRPRERSLYKKSKIHSRLRNPVKRTEECAFVLGTALSLH